MNEPTSHGDRIHHKLRLWKWPGRWTRGSNMAGRLRMGTLPAGKLTDTDLRRYDMRCELVWDVGTRTTHNARRHDTIWGEHPLTSRLGYILYVYRYTQGIYIWVAWFIRCNFLGLHDSIGNDTIYSILRILVALALCFVRPGRVWLVQTSWEGEKGEGDSVICIMKSSQGVLETELRWQQGNRGRPALLQWLRWISFRISYFHFI